MLRFLADENFNGEILRGLLLRRPSVPISRAQDVGLRSASDPEVLAWAAEHGVILLTHDRATIPRYAMDLVAVGDRMPGVLVVSDRIPTGRAIEAILNASEGSEQADWNDRVVHLSA